MLEETWQARTNTKLPDDLAALIFQDESEDIIVIPSKITTTFNQLIQAGMTFSQIVESIEFQTGQPVPENIKAHFRNIIKEG